MRRKAAIEKATARRIARESMELIEDEQLELMELAAASKGLSSMIHLDHDSLQNLELFRGRISSRTFVSVFIHLHDCFFLTLHLVFKDAGEKDKCWLFLYMLFWFSDYEISPNLTFSQSIAHHFFPKLFENRVW